MRQVWPATLPDAHRAFLVRALERLPRDRRIAGIGAAGSFADDTMDGFSDLDLVLAIEPDRHAAVMADRQEIAASLGSLLVAFTGEHVAEPRLLICLYDAPLLHVDLKFVSLPDVAMRVDDPIVLWEREGRFSAALRAGIAAYPPPDPQWMEDRFWVWVHYTAGKIARGELYEALDSLSILRARVLGPLGLQRAGHRPSGVRRLESVAPALADALGPTVPHRDPRACLDALRASVEVYRQIRSGTASEVQHRSAAEAAAVAFLDEVDRRVRGA